MEAAAEEMERKYGMDVSGTMRALAQQSLHVIISSITQVWKEWKGATQSKFIWTKAGRLCYPEAHPLTQERETS